MYLNLSKYRIIKKIQEKEIEVQPTTLMAGLLTNEEDVLKLHDRLRLSGVERDNALFVIAHREDKPNTGKLFKFVYFENK